MNLNIVFPASALIAVLTASTAVAAFDVQTPFNTAGTAFQAVNGAQANRVNHQNAFGVNGVNVINSTTRVVASVSHFSYTGDDFASCECNALQLDINYQGTTSNSIQCRAVSYDWDGFLLGQSGLVSGSCSAIAGEGALGAFLNVFLTSDQVLFGFMGRTEGFVSVYCDLPINCTITGLSTFLGFQNVPE